MSTLALTMQVARLRVLVWRFRATRGQRAGWCVGRSGCWRRAGDTGHHDALQTLGLAAGGF